MKLKDKQQRNIKKLSDSIFLIVIAFIIVIGFSTLFMKPKNRSEVENRSLTKFEIPTIKTFIDGSFQDNLESALADQFIASRKIKIIANKVFNNIDIKNNNKKICENKYVYLNSEHTSFDCDNSIINTPTNISNYTKNINKQLEYFSKVNTLKDTYYYVIDRGYAYDYENQKYIVDTFSILKNNLKNKYKISKLEVNNYDEYKNYFYKTDHHWNLNGSYQGYKDIIKMIYPNDKVLVPVGTKTIKKYKFNGSISRSSKYIKLNEEFKYYDFKLPEHFEYVNGYLDNYGNYTNPESDLKPYRNIYGIVYGEDYKEIVFDFKNPKKENLLLIASSYSNPINRLIASHFDKTYVVDFRHYENFDIEEYLEAHDIDKILVIASTDVLIEEEFLAGDDNNAI